MYWRVQSRAGFVVRKSLWHFQTKNNIVCYYSFSFKLYFCRHHPCALLSIFAIFSQNSESQFLFSNVRFQLFPKFQLFNWYSSFDSIVNSLKMSGYKDLILVIAYVWIKNGKHVGPVDDSWTWRGEATNGYVGALQLQTNIVIVNVAIL